MPETSAVARKQRPEKRPVSIVPEGCWMMLKGVACADKVVGIYKEDSVAIETSLFLGRMVRLNDISYCEKGDYCMIVDGVEIVLEKWSEDIFEKHNSATTAFIFLEEDILNDRGRKNEDIEFN